MPAGNDQTHAGIAARLVPVMREAGETALRTFRKSVRSWTKSNASPVCEADLAVDRLLHQRLPGLVPNSGWLSEETEDNPSRLSARQVWVVDPIDGTRAYLGGKEDWTISVALVEEGRPVIAAVFAPVSGQFFHAVAGSGARLGDGPIVASPDHSLECARVAGPKRYLERLGRLAPQIDPLPKVHSLALRLVRVASGELDVAFASANSHDWDLAAADLLVHEAGGTLTTVEGERLVYNQSQSAHPPLVAAGSARHVRLMDLMRAHRIDFT